MGELLIKPYEISVWEDKLTQDGFQEVKLAVIGSNTMEGPNKIYDPIFNKKANGERTLTFSLKYKYFDPYSENDEVINPFAALLVNERKIKLYYDNQWYEFIIKDHTESSDERTWTYSCTDAFVLELSKTGYNITFDAELNNNQGTAYELAKKALQNSDWQVGGAQVGKQLVEEPIYKATLVSKSNIEIINASNDGTIIPEAGSAIYIFYSYIKNRNGKFVQFIIRDDTREYTIDSKNVITDTNFRITTPLEYKENGFYKDNVLIISIGEIETKYQANRLSYGQLTTYDPVMGRTVDRFKLDDQEIYRYTDNTYTTSNVILNFITNGDNFNALEDGTLQGWNPYVDIEEGEVVKKLELVTYPEIGTGKELADLSSLSQIEGFLKIQPNGIKKEQDGKIYNTIYNSGFTDNLSFIESVSYGDKFVFRWRAGEGELGSLTPVSTLGLIVAKYTQDKPTWGYYYKHINPDDIILQFEGQPQILNNIIKGGTIREDTVTDEETGTVSTIYNYVIDDVVQTVSTKYVYINNTDNEPYVWNGINSTFDKLDEQSYSNYLPYYYIIASAKRALSNSTLRDPTERYGIFIYTTQLHTQMVEEPTYGFIKGEIQEAPYTIHEVVEGVEGTEIEIEYTDLQGEECKLPITCIAGQSKTAGGQEGDNYSFEYNATTKEITFTDSLGIHKYTIIYTSKIDMVEEVIPIYIQDIQLTRFLPDGSDEVPVLIGNVPTAVSTPTDYYYLKPKDNDSAEDIETYTTIPDLLEDLELEGTVKPLYNENSDKVLSISVSQSNRFDILQTIAETFECWVDLVVEHDEHGAILLDEEGKPKKFVYLKEYAGKDNYAGFKYATNLQSIERNINSDEIVTKLIVDQAQSEYTDEGFVSISNAPSNQSGESYILNFDYYYNQGLLDRETTEAEKIEFINAVKDINLHLQEKEKERSDLEMAITNLGSKRNVYTELVETAQTNKSEALAEFEELTSKTYEEYREIHPTLDDDEQFTEEETVLSVLGTLYANSAIINNYSGILTNIELEYWDTYDKLYGTDDYRIKIWVDYDDLSARHVFVELNDYLPGFSFTLGSYEGKSTVSKRYFDITTTETVINFVTPKDFTMESYTYEINDKKVGKFKITSVETKVGIEDEIKELREQKDDLINNFNNKYSRFIQEGTWNSTDYIDSELYYLDALQVSNTSAQPVVSYTINVVEISQLDGYTEYIFDAGDKTYIEDTEFFGWANINIGTQEHPEFVLTPAREEVIVSEVEWHLDAPDQNTITVQNYKTRFEDFFQRVSAAVQTVQYNEATYAKISSLLDANGTINQDVLLQSLNQISGKNYNLTSDGSVLINGDQILVRNLTNSANLVKIDSEGIRISSDGGLTWATAISGRGINIGTVYTGRLNTDEVIIGNSNSPSFRWDKSGISAYKSTGATSQIDGQTIDVYDLQTYVRYDQYGLYGIKDNGTFKAQSLDDVKDKAHFAVTWDGFFIKNSYEGGGQVSITSDNDFQVLQSGGSEKIKIGALEWRDATNNITTDPTQGVGAPILYGIRIKNNNGDVVMQTGDDGNLEITGKITANSGQIGGMEVDNQRLKMKYIIFEPNKGIYSTYPNELGKPPVDSSVTVPPFIISDIDGSATFNNVIVRGSIKTSVFEYEEIQAVGGAFLFRPSSAIRNARVVNTNDLELTLEKANLFKINDWLKISNFSSATTQDGVTPDELNGFGLTYVYKVRSVAGNKVILEYAAELLSAQNLSTEDLVGGSVIDMGRYATKTVEQDGETYLIPIPGDNNYGIGINSSDGFINLPPRAISLFETVIHPYQTPKVSYRFRGILGTLPQASQANIQVNSSIYPYMENTQGIYTDNMYIGDQKQYVAFYEDEQGQKHLKISAKEIVYDFSEDTGQEITWEDHIEEQIPIRVEIDSSAGNLFVRQDIQSTLTCHVFKGQEEITNQVKKFTWSKYDMNGVKDETWVRLPGGQQITIGPEDVASKAIFGCEVEI